MKMVNELQKREAVEKEVAKYEITTGIHTMFPFKNNQEAFLRTWSPAIIYLKLVLLFTLT